LPSPLTGIPRLSSTTITAGLALVTQTGRSMDRKDDHMSKLIESDE
jgi:hypothetical protein